jgi:hypothetical protein
LNVQGIVPHVTPELNVPCGEHNFAKRIRIDGHLTTAREQATAPGVMGAAIVSGQYHVLFGVALGVFAYWRKIRIEKHAVREVFGAGYDEYRRHSWALVPWLY